jgi:hypothetical protein
MSGPEVGRNFNKALPRRARLRDGEDKREAGEKPAAGQRRTLGAHGAASFNRYHADSSGKNCERCSFSGR